MYRKLLFAVLIAFTLVACVASPSMYAQSTTASLLGVVRDPSGSVITGADVTASSQ